LGAAYLAGLAIGYWSNVDEIRLQWKLDRTFSPGIQASETTELIKGWHRAVRAAIAWAAEE
jgi:glycerol kinase